MSKENKTKKGIKQLLMEGELLIFRIGVFVVCCSVVWMLIKGYLDTTGLVWIPFISGLILITISVLIAVWGE